MKTRPNPILSAVVLLLLLACGYIGISHYFATTSSPENPAVPNQSRSTTGRTSSVVESIDSPAPSTREAALTIADLVMPTTLAEFDKHEPDTSIPLRSVYEELKSAADSGHAESALELAGSLIECAEAPANTEGLDKQLMDLYQTRRVTGYAGQVQDLDAEAEKIRDRYEFCRGISREQIKEAYSYLRVSAENGNIEAAVRLNNYGPMLYAEVFEALDIAFSSRQEMVTVTNRLTFEAAEAGSAAAILRIGKDMAKAGDLLSADEARAYRIAGYHLFVQSGRNVERFELRLQEEIMAIRPSQRAEVVDAVNSILRRDNCCFFIR